MKLILTWFVIGGNRQAQPDLLLLEGPRLPGQKQPPQSHEASLQRPRSGVEGLAQRYVGEHRQLARVLLGGLHEPDGPATAAAGQPVEKVGIEDVVAVLTAAFANISASGGSRRPAASRTYRELKALGLAKLANARRIAEDFDGAERELVASREARPAEDCEDELVAAEIMALKATLLLYRASS